MTSWKAYFCAVGEPTSPSPSPSPSFNPTVSDTTCPLSGFTTHSCAIFSACDDCVQQYSSQSGGYACGWYEGSGCNVVDGGGSTPFTWGLGGAGTCASPQGTQALLSSRDVSPCSAQLTEAACLAAYPNSYACYYDTTTGLCGTLNQGFFSLGVTSWKAYFCGAVGEPASPSPSPSFTPTVSDTPSTSPSPSATATPSPSPPCARWGAPSTLVPASSSTNFFGAAFSDVLSTLFLSAPQQNQIYSLLLDGSLALLAGGFYGGWADGFGESALFDNPRGLACDATGTLYVADTNNHRIRTVTGDGLVSTLAGNGEWWYGSYDGVGTSASFSQPLALAMSPSDGALFVLEPSSVRKVIPSSGLVSTFFSYGHYYGPVNDYYYGGMGYNSVSDLQGIAVDVTGNVFVLSSQKNVILLVQQGPPSTAQVVSSQLAAPVGMVVDGSGALNVVSSYDQTVVQVTLEGTMGALTPRFNSFGALSIAQDASRSHLFVTTTASGYSNGNGWGGSVVMYSCGGSAPSTVLCPAGSFASHNSSAPCARCPAGRYCPASQPSSPLPCGMGFFCPAGASAPTPCPPNATRFVLHAAALSDCFAAAPLLSMMWEVRTLAGLGANFGGFVDGLASTRLSYPTSVAVDAAGNVIVADSGNRAIRRVTMGGLTTTVAGGGFYTTFGGVNDYATLDGIGTAATFYSASSVAVTGAGAIIVADMYLLRSVTASGAVSTLAGQNPLMLANNGYGYGGIIPEYMAPVDGNKASARFGQIASICIDGNGNILVIDNSDSLRLVTPAGDVTTLALISVTSLALDSKGLIWATTPSSSYNPCTSCLVNIAPNGTVMSRQSLSQGGGVFAPVAITFDAADNLFALDGSTSTVHMFTATSSEDKFVAGGQSNDYMRSSSNDGFGEGSSFNQPRGIAVAPSGHVIIADTENHCIRTITAQPCPAGFFCGDPQLQPFMPCSPGTYCPAGSAAPLPCPAGAPGLLASAASLSECFHTGSAAPGAAAPAGAACWNSSACASGACRGGACCSAASLSAGCGACALQTGSCLTHGPGEACAVDADCGANLCSGGCCCAPSALLTPGCTSCRCWANASTTRATAGACLGAPLPPPPSGCGCAQTPSPSATPSPTGSRTRTPTLSMTPTRTASPPPTPSRSPSRTPSKTSTPSRTATRPSTSRSASRTRTR